jgi:hypothetical protein
MKKIFTLFAILFALNANIFAPAETSSYIVQLSDLSHLCDTWEDLPPKERMILWEMFTNSNPRMHQYWLREELFLYNNIIVLTE